MLDFFWRSLAFSIIGVDTADREEIRQTIDLTFHLDPEEGMINDVSLTAQIKLREYYSQQIQSRRRAPRDDMLLTGSAGRDERKYAHADRRPARGTRRAGRDPGPLPRVGGRP